MTEPTYNIIFSGTIDKKRTLAEVRDNLAALFKKDLAEIEHFFSGDPVVLKKNIDQATAGKYQAALLKAGAVCSVVDTARPMRMIIPQDIGGPIQYFVQKSPYVSSAADGLNFNRADMGDVDFSAIDLVSAFSESTAARVASQLVFIVKGFSRPFITEVEKIRFKEFPGVIAGTVQESLKNFIRFIHEKNPGLAIDKNTFGYLEGQHDIMRIHNPSQYVNMLCKTFLTGQARMVEVNRLEPRSVLHAAAHGQPFPSVSRRPSESGLVMENPTLTADEKAQAQPDLSEVKPTSHPYQLMNQKRPGMDQSYISYEDKPIPEKSDSPMDVHYKAAESFFDEDKDEEAFAELEKCLKLNPDHWEAHHLFAQKLMADVSGAGKAKTLTKALFHARRAYESAGESRSEVVKIYADALAENGKSEEGIAVLEKTHAEAADDKIRKAVESDIALYRDANSMGTYWQFFDPAGKLFFETIYVKLIRDKLVNGSIPQNSLCRKNRVGEKQPLMNLLVKSEPSIAVMVDPVMYHVKYGAMIGGGVTGGIVGLYYVGKFLIYYIGELPQAFSDWIHLGLQNIVAFVAFLILLGIPTLMLGLVLVGIVIGVIAVGTGIAGAIPGLAVGSVIGWIVGVVREPSIPKIGSKAGNPPK